MGKLFGKLFYNFYKSLSGDSQEKVMKGIADARKKLDEVKNEKGKQEEVLYDVYISYSTRDQDAARLFCETLRKSGVSVKFGLEGTPSGTNIGDEILKSIAGSKVFVPIITKNSMESDLFKKEVETACYGAKNRSKLILPMLFSLDPASLSPAMEFLLSKYQKRLVDADNKNDIIEAASYIVALIDGKKREAQQFEMLSQYIKAGIYGKASEILCELILKRRNEAMPKNEFTKEALDILKYLEQMKEYYDHDYSEEGTELAMTKSRMLSELRLFLDEKDFAASLYLASIAVRIIYFSLEVDMNCLDVIVGRFEPGMLIDDYIRRQKPYADRYLALTEAELKKYPEAERNFILDTKHFFCDGNMRVKARTTQKTVLSEGDELLHSVANFMKEGNRILDIIGNKKPAKEFLKCVITSYERLKAYSEVVGAKEVCAECIEKIAELKARLSKMNADNTADEKAEAGIKTLLGLTVPKSGEYDVFISHKREDFDLAVDMYEFLKANLKEPFFDKYSLPEMSDANYSKAIMQALDGSKHFVVVISSLDYLESDWISLEMEVFQAEKNEGRKQGNFLMVVTDDVYDKIMKSNKSVLPIEYRRCEIIKFADYKNTLLNYIS